VTAGRYRYLLDTNVLSEPRRQRPSSAVLEWLDSLAGETLATSVVCIGEIIEGILRVEERSGARASALRSWLEGIESSHAVLSVDRAAIGEFAAMRLAQPGRNDLGDLLIAATARAHGLTVVTRNARHFTPLGVPVVDPWVVAP
jgi:predicted nucleic acid-binding protein